MIVALSQGIRKKKQKTMEGKGKHGLVDPLSATTKVQTNWLWASAMFTRSRVQCSWRDTWINECRFADQVEQD